MRFASREPSISRPVNLNAGGRGNSLTTGSQFTLVFFAVVLGISAILKWDQLRTEVTAAAADTTMWNSRWFLTLVSVSQWLFAIWVCTGCVGLAPRLTWTLASVAACALAASSFVKLLAQEPHCGCFGKLPVSPAQSLTISTACVLALWLWPPLHSHPLAWRTCAWRFAVYLAIAVPIALYGTATVAAFEPTVLTADGELIGDSEIVVLRPHEWLGRQLGLLRYVEVPERLDEGAWIVVFVQPRCKKCDIKVRQYEELAAQLAHASGAPRVAFIDITGEYDSSSIGANACVWGSLSPQRRWHLSVPVELRLHDGQVLQVALENGQN